MKLALKIALGGVAGLVALGSLDAARLGMSSTTTIVHDAATDSTPAAGASTVTGAHSSTKAGTAADAKSGQALAACMEGTGQANGMSTIHISSTAGFGMAEIYTSLEGGFGSPDQGAGQLIVGAFTQCVTPADGSGLVTVYGSDGNILANGNY